MDCITIRCNTHCNAHCNNRSISLIILRYAATHTATHTATIEVNHWSYYDTLLLVAVIRHPDVVPHNAPGTFCQCNLWKKWIASWMISRYYIGSVCDWASICCASTLRALPVKVICYYHIPNYLLNHELYEWFNTILLHDLIWFY